ncbi:MAG: STAS domain-containing protein [Candidatus Omnitrophota bacterium]|nr:STAS domain-containing protein [Candidatus Omnitrophota bacterium]
MNIRSENKNGISVVRVEGNVDIITSPEFKKYLDKIAVSGSKTIVVDLGKVDYMDSSGLATLVEAYKNIKRSGGAIKLLKLSSKVKGLFEITKLDKLFQIFEDEGDALKS